MIIYDCNHLRHHFYNLCAGSEVKHTQRPLSEKYHEQTKATNHLLHDKKTYFYMELVSRWALGLWRGLSLIVDWSQSQDNWKPIFLFFFLKSTSADYISRFIVHEMTFLYLTTDLKTLFCCDHLSCLRRALIYFPKKKTRQEMEVLFNLDGICGFPCSKKAREEEGSVWGLCGLLKLLKEFPASDQFGWVQVELEFSHPTVRSLTMLFAG